MWNVDSRTLAISLSVGGLVAGIVYLWYQKQVRCSVIMLAYTLN